MFGLVCLGLRCTQFVAGRDFGRVKIADSEIAQPLLQAHAVGEGVFGTAESAPPPNIAKRIHARTLQRAEKRRLVRTVDAYGDYFHLCHFSLTLTFSHRAREQQGISSSGRCTTSRRRITTWRGYDRTSPMRVRFRGDTVKDQRSRDRLSGRGAQ